MSVPFFSLETLHVLKVHINLKIKY